MDQIISIFKDFPGENDYQKAHLAFLCRINQTLQGIEIQLVEMNGGDTANVSSIAHCLNAVADCVKPIMHTMQSIDNTLGLIQDKFSTL
jgi:hypothetical protein